MGLKSTIGGGAPTPTQPPDERINEMESPGIDPGLLALMKNENGDDKTLWLFLLLLLYGKDGGLGGRGGDCCPPVTLEQLTQAQNAIQNQMQNVNQNSNDHFLQASDTAARNQMSNERNSMGIQNSIAVAQASTLAGQKDITAAIANCCCQNLLSQKDTQKGLCDVNTTVATSALATQNVIQATSSETQRALEACCCENRLAIERQTNALERAICADGQATRALITDNRMMDLQTALAEAKAANSNLRQTVELTNQIREACCQPCRPCPSIPIAPSAPAA